MRPIASSEPAPAEFSEAVRWYEARRPGLGGDFFDEVTAILNPIELKRTRKSERSSRPTAKRAARW